MIRLWRQLSSRCTAKTFLVWGRGKCFDGIEVMLQPQVLIMRSSPRPASAPRVASVLRDTASLTTGVVGNRTLRVGQYVQTGTQLMAVVPIHEVYIIANYKETQLTHVFAGQPVKIEVDMFPGTTFAGHVDSLLGFALFGSVYVLPQYLGQVQRYNAEQIGQVLAWTGLPQLLLIPLVPRLMKIADVRYICFASIILFAVSCHRGAIFRIERQDSDFRARWIGPVAIMSDTGTKRHCGDRSLA
jgi:Barrel-sandwich domain of CusB or HlyD membrane-fusion